MSAHEYATQEITFGTSATFQAKCTCGWVCGIVHRVNAGASAYQKSSAEAIARGEFEQHFMAAVPA